MNKNIIQLEYCAFSDDYDDLNQVQLAQDEIKQFSYFVSDQLVGELALENINVVTTNLQRHVGVDDFSIVIEFDKDITDEQLKILQSNISDIENCVIHVIDGDGVSDVYNDGDEVLFTLNSLTR